MQVELPVSRKTPLHSKHSSSEGPKQEPQEGWQDLHSPEALSRYREREGDPQLKRQWAWSVSRGKAPGEQRPGRHWWLEGPRHWRQKGWQSNRIGKGGTLAELVLLEEAPPALAAALEELHVDALPALVIQALGGEGS